MSSLSAPRPFARAALVVVALLAAPAAAAQAIVVQDTRIEVKERIFFEEGTATVSARSSKLLDELARALTDHPRFTRVVIEGHTDSVGDAERNLLLSQARANAVKKALVERGVKDGRVEAVGFGSSRPIASNRDAVGRGKNRRVEIVVAEIDGKRVIAARPPLAKVTRAHNRVTARAPDDNDWVRANAGHGLFRLHRVQSRERSAADITFRDASAMSLREQTLVIIFGAAAEKVRRETGRARLESGALRTRLAELAGQLVVETAGAEAELGQGTALVSVDEERTSRIANHGGKRARVFARRGDKREGKPVAVEAGFGSKVVEGKAPSPPRPLPPTPTWDVAGGGALGLASHGATLTASWKPVPSATRYRVELAGTADGGGLVIGQEVSADITRLEVHGVPAGTWHARVAAIDDDGFEGIAATTAYEVSLLAVEGRPVPEAPSPSTDAPAVTALAAGTVLTAPEGKSCTVNDGAPTSRLVLPATRVATVRCAGALALDVPVEARAPEIVIEEGFRGGPARVRLKLPPGTPPLDVVVQPKGKVLRQQRDGDELAVLLHTEAGAAPAELALRNDGVVFAKVALPLAPDETPPTLAVETTRDGRDQRVTATAADDVSGVALVRLYHRAAGGGPWEVRPMEPVSDGVWEASVPRGHEVYATALDRAGNGPTEARPPADGTDSGADATVLALGVTAAGVVALTLVGIVAAIALTSAP